ncbi:MAG: hypothetical protein ABSA53_38565 [Streptosporangiaceae bacterium]|jgi:hypothetical protein
MAPPRKTAAGVDSSSGLCGYGDQQQGARPVAAAATARSGDPPRADGSADRSSFAGAVAPGSVIVVIVRSSLARSDRQP